MNIYLSISTIVCMWRDLSSRVIDTSGACPCGIIYDSSWDFPLGECFRRVFFLNENSVRTCR